MTHRCTALALSAFIVLPLSAQVTIDTLPGRIVRTISKAPLNKGQWHLTLERTIQPPDGSNGELIDPSDLAIGPNGLLYVVDDKPLIIKVYSPEGQYLRSIGREGDGPGEFRVAYIALRGDTLLVHDPRLGRSSTFLASTGKFLGVKTTARMYWSPIAVDGTGHGVVPTVIPAPVTNAPMMNYVRFTLTGTALDTVRIPMRPTPSGLKIWGVKNPDGPGYSMVRTVPLRPTDIFGVDRHGGFVTGWSGEYLLRTSRNGNDTTSLFGRTWTPERVTAAMKRAITDAIVASSFTANQGTIPEATFRSSFDVDAIPDIRPAFEAVATDPAGRRWVRISQADTTVARYDLFDERGRWLDQVSVPTAKWPREAYAPVAWSTDRVAVIVHDQNDKPLIAVYRITRTP